MIKTIIFVLLYVPLIFPQEFHVDKSKKNLVRFISDAPLEDFDGVTNNIDGYMYLKSIEDLTDNHLYFEVDLTTMDTGIELRNRHMRDNYLETDKFRFTFFEGSIKNVRPQSNNVFSVEVGGTLFIRGVTNEIIVYGVLNSTDNGYVVETEFVIALSEYNVDIPQLMFMKINEEIKLQLKFYLVGITNPGG